MSSRASTKPASSTSTSSRRGGAVLTPPPVAGGATTVAPTPKKGGKKVLAPAQDVTVKAAEEGVAKKVLPPKPFPRFLALFRPVEESVTISSKELLPTAKMTSVPINELWDKKLLAVEGTLLGLVSTATSFAAERDVSLMVTFGRMFSQLPHEEAKGYSMSSSQHTTNLLGPHWCYKMCASAYENASASLGFCPDHTFEPTLEKAVSTCNIPMLQHLHKAGSVFGSWANTKEALVGAIRYRNAPVLRYAATVLAEELERDRRLRGVSTPPPKAKTNTRPTTPVPVAFFLPNTDEQAAPLVEAIKRDWLWGAEFLLKECGVSPLFHVVLDALCQHGSPNMLRLVMSRGLDSNFARAALTDAAQPLDVLHDTLIHFRHHRNQSTLLEFLSLVLFHLKCSPFDFAKNQSSAFKLVFVPKHFIRQMPDATRNAVRWLLVEAGVRKPKKENFVPGFWAEVEGKPHAASSFLEAVRGNGLAKKPAAIPAPAEVTAGGTTAPPPSGRGRGAAGSGSRGRGGGSAGRGRGRGGPSRRT